MKYIKAAGMALLGLVLCVWSLEAQSESESLKGMSFNGATGLYSIPSAKIGWERESDLGFDFGYHAIISEGKATHIPKFSVSLFKWVELSAAYDFQPRRWRNDDDNDDFITGIKVQLPITRTAVALGGNFQLHETMNDSDRKFMAGQIYAAVTYSGTFFDMPAETTVVVGKTFIEDESNSDIDFGMGFDLVFFPKVLDGFVHWVTDFANFSYSAAPFGAVPWYRGVLNTGFRIDLSRIPSLNKFKFTIDAVVTDAFDDDRGFSLGVAFGIPIL